MKKNRIQAAIDSFDGVIPIKGGKLHIYSLLCVNSRDIASWLVKENEEHCECGYCKVRVDIERNGHGRYTYILTKDEVYNLIKEAEELYKLIKEALGGKHEHNKSE